jgi:C-terminal processing protease CtpA/Prc
MKISRNSITLLRANGQIEEYKLRIVSKPGETTTTLTKNDISKVLEEAIKQKGEQEFDIQLPKIKKILDPVDQIIEKLKIGTAYEEGKIVGQRIGKVKEGTLWHKLGLQKGDIIKKLNGVPLTTVKNRLVALYVAEKMDIGDSFSVELERDGTDMEFVYNLSDMKKSKDQKEVVSLGAPTAQSKPGSASALTRRRQTALRKFAEKFNSDSARQKTVSDLRNRWLENLRKRSPNVRLRR